MLIALYVLMLKNFNVHDMIYFSRLSIIGADGIYQALGKDMFRFVIGMVGSIIVIALLHLLISKCCLKGKVLTILSYVGRCTFGIYVFQDIVLLFVEPIFKFVPHVQWPIRSAIGFFFISFVSFMLMRISSQYKVATLLFLGGSPMPKLNK